MARQFEVNENNYFLMAHLPGQDRALEMLFEHGLAHRARSILESRSEFKKLASLMEKYDDPASAAQYYFMAKEYQKAAEIYQSLGKFTQAGQAYASMKAYQKALEMFQKSGKNKMRIASMHEKLGNWEEAAKLWKAMGKHKKAQQCLARIDIQKQLDLE